MKAVGAARKWWAARRPRLVARIAAPAAPAAATVRLARGSSLSLLLLAAALLACALIGLAVTHDNDRRLAAERHDALQTAVAELRPLAGDVDRFSGAQLDLLARLSGLKDLRFGAVPERGGGREYQSLQDASGRIVGWFSWTPDRAPILAMDWLWSCVGIVGVALVICAAIGRRAADRLARLLDRSVQATHRLTTEDALTGLPNRRVMLDSLERALRGRGAAHVAFALLDLDGLREINDTLGRAGGDAGLIGIAERLRAGLPAGAQLGRFEDDEFAAIAGGDGPATAPALVAALRAALAEPFALAVAGQGAESQAGQGAPAAAHVFRISAGIGVAQAPEDGATAEELARRAVLALRAAKRDGRGAVRRFMPQIESEHVDRRFLLRELKAAVSNNAFDVHYQPIVAASGTTMIGVEALLRWSHPERGAIAPASFIPLAERCGLMNDLGQFVLRRALADAARWPDLSVAVNLSPVQIRDGVLVDLVAGAIAEAAIDPSRVVLEITEGTLIDDPDKTQNTLARLRALGVSIALDDFGTGYSSLSYLQKFPFQRLKIDRAFVASLGTIGNAGAIIQSIVTLGHALGMSVLAEGVETDQQRVLLRLAGCDEMQGYLFATPRPADAIDRMLAHAADRPARSQVAS